MYTYTYVYTCAAPPRKKRSPREADTALPKEQRRGYKNVGDAPIYIYIYIYIYTHIYVYIYIYREREKE